MRLISAVIVDNLKQDSFLAMIIFMLIVFGFGFAIDGYSQTPLIINSIAGSSTIPGFGGDGGPATAAHLDFPHDIAVDHSNNKYIADEYNHRIRKINSSGIISTIAGNSTTVGYGSVGGYGGDGGPATSATLNRPVGIAMDGTGNIYIADAGNYRIRKIDGSGIITTIAGTGTNGCGGDGGPATSATINVSGAGTTTGGCIGLDASGNIYIADGVYNHIRKINSAGIISTIAGTGTAGLSGDGGPATAATLNMPEDIAFDQIGNAYIADCYNHRIRKINTAGIISTFAGSGTGPYGGMGGPATSASIMAPEGVAADSAGNVYLSILTRILKVDTSGIVTTIAGINLPGSGCGGWDGDPCSATASGVCMQSAGIAIDDSGNIYIADTDDEHVRKVGRDAVPWFINGSTQYLTICEGTVADTINSLLVILDSDVNQTEIWSINAAPIHGTLSSSYTATSTGDTITPAGLYYTPATGYLGADSFKIKVVDCGGSADSTTIYVAVISSTSDVTITGPSMLCTGATAGFSATYGGGVWTSSNTTVATVGSLSGIVTGIASGSATVSYTLTPACGAAPATKTLTVNPIPAAGVISGHDTLCVGNSDMLTETVSGGMWSVSNSNATIGTTGSLLGISIGADTVIYTVTISGCTASKKIKVYVLPHGSCPWLGEENLLMQPFDNLQIYPNPSSGEILVRCSEKGEFKLYNIEGQQVALFNIRAGDQEIRLPVGITEGVYVLEFKSVTGLKDKQRLIITR